MDEHVNVGKAKPKHIHVSSLMPGCGQRLYSTFLKQFAEIKYNMCLEEQKINDERAGFEPALSHHSNYPVAEHPLCH